MIYEIKKLEFKVEQLITENTELRRIVKIYETTNDDWW